MLSERQKTALNMLIENYSKAIALTSSEIAQELEVTTKTVQNDIKSLNTELEKLKAGVVTVPGKGYKLQVLDEESLLKCMELLSEDHSKSELFNRKDERVRYIIGMLMFSKTPILSDMIAYDTFVSRSQISQDIKEVKEILKNYSLQIKTKGRQGIYIEGEERDKRLCLVKEKISCHRYSKSDRPMFQREELGNIVISVLTEEEYEISDLDLQNLLFYIEVAAWRIRHGFLLQDSNQNEKQQDVSKEWIISAKIYKKISTLYELYTNEYELDYLTTIFQGVRMFKEGEVVTDEMEQLMKKLLYRIKDNFNFDFEGNIEMRMNLSLHLAPLIIRAKNNLLAMNPLLDYIKQSLTLAYDIAVVARNVIEEYYQVELNEDEAGYLAVHFAMALNNIAERSNAQRVLIITSSRKSDEILLHYNVMKHFEELVQILDICQISDIRQVNLKLYDVIFTTVSEERFDELPDNAIKIDYFLSAQDRLVMENALMQKDGRRSPESFFREDLFFYNPPVKSREELLRFLCDQMDAIYEYQEDLYALVIEREELGTTLFTNNIALPHPVRPFCECTMASVAVLDEGIPWGDGKAKIVFMLNIRADGEREMELLYGFLSAFLQNKTMIKKLKDAPEYASLMEIIAEYESEQG